MLELEKQEIMKENNYYFVYADHLLGVQTNDSSFKWIYGRTAPNTDEKSLEACLIRIYVKVISDDSIQISRSAGSTFQCHTWDEKEKKLTYCRKMMGIPFAYTLSVQDNAIYAVFGKNYYRFLQFRFMNMHAAYYMLSDLANMLLLKNGFATLYCSAVFHRESGKALALFAPPNTGKSLTAKQLCDTGHYAHISEDVAIIDRNKQIVGCPWTDSYRKPPAIRKIMCDTGGAFGRKHGEIVQREGTSRRYTLSDMIVLDRSKGAEPITRQEIENRILILNRYLFGGYHSPIVNIIGFFDRSYNHDWVEKAKEVLSSAFEECRMQAISCENPEMFSLEVDKRMRDK